MVSSGAHAEQPLLFAALVDDSLNIEAAAGLTLKCGGGHILLYPCIPLCETKVNSQESKGHMQKSRSVRARRKKLSTCD